MVAPPSVLVSPQGGAASAGRNGSVTWMALPAFAMFLLFGILPLFGVLLLSFTNWDGLGDITLAGLANWRTVLSGPGLLALAVGHLRGDGPVLGGPDTAEHPARRVPGGQAALPRPSWRSSTSCRCC